MSFLFFDRVRELQQINRKREFIEFREQNIKNIFITITFAGIAIVFFFHIFDTINDFPRIHEMFIAKIAISTILLINLSLVLFFNTRKVYILFLYFGFYQTAFFCTLISHYTGGLSSTYWGGLILMLIIWHSIIPINYKLLDFHGTIFIVQYLVILFYFEPKPVYWEYFWEGTFFLLGTHFVGMVAGFLNNQSDALLFKNQEVIQQTRSALTKSELLYQTLINNANDGIFITQDNVFKFVNASFCEITGYTENELINKPFNDLIIPEDHQKLMEIHLKRMRGEKVPSIYSTQGVAKDGRKIHLEFNSNTIELDGRPASFVIMRDETQHILSEQAIKESEEKYKLLVERANDGIVILQDGIVVFINQMMANILGFEVTNMLNTPFINYLAPEEVERIYQYYLQRLAGISVPSIYESVLVDKSRILKAVEFNSSIINFKGKPATQVFIRDITERKNAEQALKESEVRYREMADFLPQMIYEVNIDGTVSFINRTGIEQIGYSYDEILQGIHISQFVIPEQRKELLENLKATLLGGEPSKAKEFTALRKDGSTFPIMVYDSPIYKKGVVVGNRGTVADISLRKKAEEELRNVNQRLTFHIYKTPLAYIEWNSTLEVVEWNPTAEKIFGFTHSEAIGKHAYDLIVPEEIKDTINEVLDDIINEKGGAFNVNENITKDGKIIICQWYNTPLKDHNGKVIGLASLVQDITQRKQLEAELEKTLATLEKKHMATVEKMQSYFTELQIKKNELLHMQKENLQSQFETLKNQVNPHFLFNSLNVLASLISVDPDLAEQFTGKLSKIYRYVLEHKSDDLVSLQTEVDFLNAYVFLLSIRFSNKLVVNISIPDDKSELTLPPLALQLLIENAIKHNVFSTKSPLIIDIFIDSENYLNIVNNLQKREQHIETTHIGLVNIANRYRFFTDKPTQFGIEGDKFIARIPLI
ncbi:MAG: PAS domain S-box protein [Lentimicrobiaceae bacterium]|nr:PAS domain S-box protein [Lentimicrobiaceae bacterium]